MPKKHTGLLLLAFALFGVSTSTAQGLESLGTRAAGMAAFVAVADDASAVAWNPSGLVTGPIFNFSFELGRITSYPQDGHEAGRGSSMMLALGSLPVGFAFYRLSRTMAEVAGPAVLGSPDRQDEGQVIVRALVTNHLGATVQQSVGNYLTLGATLKLVRGSVKQTVGPVSSPDQALDLADAGEATGSTRSDLDVGAMLAVGSMRAGLVVRNVTEPTFGDADDGGTATLGRQARAGIAWSDRWPGTARTIVAFDADLTRVPSASGERRDVAAGIERWVGAQQLGVRGGVRASTVGEARPVATLGASYAVRAGVYVDAYVARGDRSQSGWGLAARVSY